MQKVSVALVLATLLISASAGVTANPEYKITLEDGFDTPNQEVELEGASFTVRGVAGISAGETITASITQPEDDSYRVYVYGTRNGNRVIMDRKYVGSGSSVSFDTDGYDAGSYTVALYADNDYQAVYPFVVRGVELSTSVPDSVTHGQELAVDTSISQQEDDIELTGVEFVLAGTDTSRRIEATSDTEDYSATFSTEGLASGEYRVYAVAKNDSQTPTGSEELIGLSAPQTVSVDTQETTETGPSDPGSGGDGGGSSGETDETTAASTPATTTTVTATPATNTTTATETTSSDPTTQSSITDRPSVTTSENTATPDNVINPSSETASTTPTTTPGFTILLTVVAIGGFLLVVRE